MKKGVLLFVSLLLFSCQDGVNIIEDSPKFNESIEVAARLKFSSKEELQSFLDEMTSDESSRFNSEFIKIKLKNLGISLRSTNESNFVSLLDEIRKNDLSGLTLQNWDEINADRDGLVYIPQDSIIGDIAFASVLNNKREIQIGSEVYRFVENGVFVVSEKDAILLNSIDKDITLRSAKNIDSRITFIPAPASIDDSSVSTRASLPTKVGAALVFSNGLSLPSSVIRDLNYNERGDGSWLHNTWTSLWGRNIVAYNNFDGSRRMRLNFYDQDYIIYKNIGTKINMQKKKFWIWWNTKAEEIRVGWSAIELEESYPFNPYQNIPKPNPVQFPPHPNASSYEQITPAFLSKNFPFDDKKHVIFTIPVANFDFTNKYIDIAYYAALKTVDAAIKSYMRAYSVQNTFKNPDILTRPNSYTQRFIIAPYDDSRIGRDDMEKKFYSEWLQGTYTIGYSTNIMSPTASFGNIRDINLKGTKTTLKRGCVYGAVKYGGYWKAVRILKSE